MAMEFAPLNLAGVYRPLRFANELNRNGITPIILTFELDENFKKIYDRMDLDLMSKLDEGVIIKRIPLDDLSPLYVSKWKRFRNIYFSLSDNYDKLWSPKLNEALPAIIKEFQPEAIMVTCPPFSGAVLAMEVSKKYQLPLIVDMRDSWSKLSMSPLGSYLHYALKRRLEWKVFHRASAVIAVTPQLRDIFTNTHPALLREKFHVIYNTAESDLQNLHSVEAPSIAARDAIHIGYTGTFYYFPESREMTFKPWWRKKGHQVFQYTPIKEDWLYRSPYFFFKVLSRVLHNNPEWRRKIFFNYIGQPALWLTDMVKRFGLQENVIFHGYVPNHKVKLLEKGFDYLLSTSEKVIGKEHYCLPSKLFTYVESNKPVLAFVTKGIQNEFVTRSNIGLVFDPDQEDENVEKLSKILREGFTARVSSSYLDDFGPGKAGRQLVDLVREVTKSGYKKGKD